MQFHQLNDLNESYELKALPSSQLYRTVSKSNDMQFHQLNDSCELTKALPHNSSQIQSVHNEIQFHQLHDSYESYELTRTLPWNNTQIHWNVSFITSSLVQLVPVAPLESPLSRLEQVLDNPLKIVPISITNLSKNGTKVQNGISTKSK